MVAYRNYFVQFIWLDMDKNEKMALLADDRYDFFLVGPWFEIWIRLLFPYRLALGYQKKIRRNQPAKFVCEIFF